MSNNKQSSIDILCGKLAMKLGIPHAITFYIDHQQEIAEAKAMHKEEIIHSHLLGLIHSLEKEATKQAEEYYNETFGSES